MNTTSIVQEEFIAFDLETTGLHPVFARIVEFGAVRFRGDGTVLGTFQQLVDPRCAISPGAMAVNGITGEMVSGQPQIEEVLPLFDEFVGDVPVVMMAHNAGFDLGFLAVAYGRLGMQTPVHRVIDTLALARCQLNLSSYRLDAVGSSMGLVNAVEHRALEDALLLKDIFLNLIRLSPQVVSIDKLLKIVPVLSFKQFEANITQAPAGYEVLWEAIVGEKVVEMCYMGGSRPGSIRKVTPLGVIQLNGYIYLSAFCHQSGINKTFRLDRIASYRRLE